MAASKKVRIPALSNVAIVRKVEGLTPPSGKSRSFPLLWYRSGTLVPKKPDWIRWMWHPRTGTMYIGRVTNHYQFLKDRAQLLKWVRGFYFPEAKIIAVRTFFNPTHLGVAFSNRHAQIDDAVSQRIVSILKRKMPRVRYVTGIDNQWLEAYFPGMCAW